MDGLKPEAARQSFWCGILNKESTTAAPAALTRTVRGPYSAFSGGTQKNDKTGSPAGQGTNNGESPKRQKS